MTDRELMQMALDALDTLGAGTSYKTHNTAKALRDRLAQPESVHASDMSQKRVDETAKSGHEWVGLTDEEVGGLTVFDRLHDVEVPILADFVRAIEAKLKEKNT
jgi:hypothetical protein